MTKYVKIGLVLALIGTAGFVTMQNPDLKATLDYKVSLAKPAHANTADSGIRVDRAGYACLMAAINTGVADNGTALSYQVVLIDSTPGVQAWVLQDSVTVDTIDNKTYEMNYRGTQRWVRLLARATGQAADTFATNGLFTLGCKRSG